MVQSEHKLGHIYIQKYEISSNQNNATSLTRVESKITGAVILWLICSMRLCFPYCLYALIHHLSRTATLLVQDTYTHFMRFSFVSLGFDAILTQLFVIGAWQTVSMGWFTLLCFLFPFLRCTFCIYFGILVLSLISIIEIWSMEQPNMISTQQKMI